MNAVLEEKTRVAERRQPKARRRGGVRVSKWDRVGVYLFIAPQVIWWLVFSLYPLFESYRIVLFDWNTVTESGKFIGLGNFVKVATDPIFWRTFGNSFKYAVFQVPIQLFLALILAMILNASWMKWVKVYRTLFYIPSLLSMAIIGLVLSLMLNPYDGVVNLILQGLHIIKKPLNFLGDERFAFPTIITIGVWQTLGINMVYFLAALQSIPKELYEAADLDGARAPRRLYSITLPLIRPVALLILMLAVLGSLGVFELVLTTTYGGPAYSTEVVQTYIYKLAFASGASPQVGYASAAALLMSFMLLGLTGIEVLAVRRMRQRRKEYGL